MILGAMLLGGGSMPLVGLPVPDMTGQTNSGSETPDEKEHSKAVYSAWTRVTVAFGSQLVAHGPAFL